MARSTTIVNNFGNEYSGPITLADATTVSDNSVFTQVGMSPSVGTKRIGADGQADGDPLPGLRPTTR